VTRIETNWLVERPEDRELSDWESDGFIVVLLGDRGFVAE
jgi:hypothetical protein